MEFSKSAIVGLAVSGILIAISQYNEYIFSNQVLPCIYILGIGYGHKILAVITTDPKESFPKKKA
ncbi:hypothetical protein Q4534_23010 [Cyclobacterium sp. 1_MG-2023]|uniref:hypothetical protein n=1 Tax=Cyclobacterium sp. 1_MG-2023 TaxID=3062681 RepID=UPI0026E1635A|nr:hypothetical protein [Cyclobacterium sp. 1_MG-2023]MDO6440315.1 hypothetical protein [Cyclobacterium sp. 1_MG-2023]